MPWTCEICSLKNLDDGDSCDLCSSPRGAVNPDADDPKKRVESKRESLTQFLRQTPQDFERANQEQRRLQELKKTKGVFGVPLKSSCPRVVCDCMAYLETHGMKTEGLFRVPGDTDTVNTLKSRYEANESDNVLGSLNLDVHDVGTLFKLYFRLLPEPLLPISHYARLMESVRREDVPREELVEGVMNVLRDLPSPQRECFGFILRFLKQVTKLEQYNKMTPANLATCFAPSLLRAPETESAEQAFLDMSAAISALNILIRHDEDLPHPSEKEVQENTRYPRPARTREDSGMMMPPPGMGDMGPRKASSNAGPPAPPPPPGFLS